MNSKINIAEPKYEFDDIIHEDLFNDSTIFLGCISFEKRSKAAAEKIACFKKIPMSFVQVEDDQCTYPTWKDECDRKTLKNWIELKNYAEKYDLNIGETPIQYKMSLRAEIVSSLKNDIQTIISKHISKSSDRRIILDLTCMPSYFAFQFIRNIINDEKVSDLLVLYTKPGDYPPEEETLKISPFDNSKPDFLPFFGKRKQKFEKFNWIVGLGFDYDSVKNAERIREVIDIEYENFIIPFPGYKPEYVIRTMKKNRDLIGVKKDFKYAPADNPFRTYNVIKELVKNNKKFILSTFGPKPLSLGFCLAAIKFNLPIIHVQATNYNPNFSTGSGNTYLYWIKYNGKVWWEY